jgi:hypothetical protein
LNEYVEVLEKNNSPEIDSEANDTYIVLFGRSFDVVTPIIHDFHLLPLIFDLLDLKDFGILMPQKDEKAPQVKLKLNEMENNLYF